MNRAALLRLTLLATLSAASSRAEEPRNFEDHILPLLREHCTNCHRPGKTRGGLDVTTMEKLEKGSSAGPSVVAGLAEGTPTIPSRPVTGGRAAERAKPFQ
jgi:hypothetical protein